MTCAFVPPMPNELTPARRGESPSLHALSFVLTKKGLLAKSMFGFSFSKCRLGGSCLCLSVCTVLIKPATPAAASRCPMFVLTEPMAQKLFLSVLRRKACVSAAISTGSPSAVPVPCVSM